MSADETAPQVFISYSHRDRTFAENLANRLTADGVVVWYDQWRLHVGDSIVHGIQEGLSSSDFLAVLLSRNATESDWVGQELNVATVRNIESHGVFILPVLIEQCTIPIFLSDKKYADFRNDPNLGYRELLSAIDYHFGKHGVRRRSFSDNRLAIAHMSISQMSDFPIVKFTISNRSGISQIINCLEYDVVEYCPAAGIPETRVLKSIVVWDITLPYGEGSFVYEPPDPILLANDDACTISLRFSCDYHGNAVSPRKTAFYRLRVRFKSDQGLIAASDVFSV